MPRQLRFNIPVNSISFSHDHNYIMLPLNLMNRSLASIPSSSAAAHLFRVKRHLKFSWHDLKNNNNKTKTNKTTNRSYTEAGKYLSEPRISLNQYFFFSQNNGCFDIYLSLFQQFFASCVLFLLLAACMHIVYIILYFIVQHQIRHFPVSILYKSIAGRYRPVRVADGPITARYRFIKNASWVFIFRPNNIDIFSLKTFVVFTQKHAEVLLMSTHNIFSGKILSGYILSGAMFIHSSTIITLSTGTDRPVQMV